MSDPHGPESWAALVPELSCSDLAASLGFYVGHLGFAVRFERPGEGFAYLEREGAQIMLEVAGAGWETAPMERPFGRGINLQIEVSDIGPLVTGLTEAGWPLFEPPHDAWYCAGEIEHGQRQFLVQDPDGYLLRFVQVLGERPAADSPGGPADGPGGP